MEQDLVFVLFFVLDPFYYLTVHSHEVAFLFGSVVSCRQRPQYKLGGQTDGSKVVDTVLSKDATACSSST